MHRLFEGYSRHILTSPFGLRVHPTGGAQKMHNGVDLVATADGVTGQVARIKAHTGGVVDGVGYDKDAGNFIRIQVDLDTKMYYFHMRDKSNLAVGEVIQAGQIIGTMGETGSVTGAHLHFGIKYKGQWIDPAPYLEKDWVHPQETCSVTLPILRNGDKGSAVRSMQILLAENGHKGEMNEKAYGSFGGKTENALKSYQEAVGLPVSGECDEETWTKLIGG